MTKLDIQNTIKLLNQYKLSGVDENIGNMAKNRYGKEKIEPSSKPKAKEEKDFPRKWALYLLHCQCWEEFRPG